MTRTPSQDVACRSHGPRDVSRAALDFVQELLEAAETEPCSPDLLLPRLARIFDVSGAGLAGFRDGVPLVRLRASCTGQTLPPRPWPWEERPELLVQLQSQPTALPLRTADDWSLLLTASAPQEGSGWLLWLEEVGPRDWSAAERGALSLAALAVARFLRTEVSSGSVAHWTEQARFQQRLEDAARIVGRVAHDFNNILTGIMGFTELSLAQVPSGSLLQQYVAAVYEAAQKGVHLTSQLRLLNQRLPSSSFPFALGDVLEPEVESRRAAWGYRITLNRDVPADLPLVACDAEPLQQVLAHLLDNAQEALAEGGTITLAARPVTLSESEGLELLGNPGPGAYVEIAVSDDGPGFSPEARHNVFLEPFFSTKPRHRGLGLALVFRILHAFRGGLSIDPEPERGTVVRVYLPAAAHAIPLPPPTPAVEEGARGEHVLVVDDDPLILQLMCTTLDKAGYRVRGAGDAAQALAAYQSSSEPFDLVLTDVVMPGMTGFDLARRLLQHDAGVNVLFTSGHIPAALSQEGFSGRQFELLSKPFRSEGLLRAVRAALDRQGRRGASSTGLGTRGRG